MNCQRFESVAGELARNQMMDADLRGEALAHSADCSSCAARLRSEEMLTRGLHSLVADMGPLEAPAAIEARLLTAFRRPEVVAPVSGASDRRPYWLVAVAALLLIVFGVIALRLRSEAVILPDREIAAPKEVPVNQPILKQNGEQPPTTAQNHSKHPKFIPRPQRSIASPELQARNRSDRKKDNNVVANHATSEVATEFMPLAYLNAAVLEDGGQIVRVELPRSALVNFGLPVNMDRYNERVKADILLGVDGMAHAIRFVQEKRLE